MGVKRTGDILEKGTWAFVLVIIVCSMLLNVMGPSTSGSGGRADQINTTAPITAPLPSMENVTPAPTTQEADTN